MTMVVADNFRCATLCGNGEEVQVVETHSNGCLYASSNGSYAAKACRIAEAIDTFFPCSLSPARGRVLGAFGHPVAERRTETMYGDPPPRHALLKSQHCHVRQRAPLLITRKKIPIFRLSLACGRQESGSIWRLYRVRRRQTNGGTRVVSSTLHWMPCAAICSRRA